MSRADDIFDENIRTILNSGYSTINDKVWPHWADDGAPAYTYKAFAIVNRYNLAEEFPMFTKRWINFKAAVDELLWIWQKKSNNVNDLNSHIWDSWADETGSIGKAYGYQLGVKHKYKEGEFDQVDRVLYDLKNNPSSRRIMTNIYVHQDLHEMHLYPCAYSMTFNVTGNKLNAKYDYASFVATVFLEGRRFRYEIAYDGERIRQEELCELEEGKEHLLFSVASGKNAFDGVVGEGYDAGRMETALKVECTNGAGVLVKPFLSCLVSSS